MASGPTASWQIDRETMETVTDFIFLGSKITADGDCSHETKRCLLRGRKAMTNLSSILKNRDVTLPTKAHLVKAMVFRVVIYWCESWTIKKTEHWRTDAFELWCSRRLLRVPWTARRSNQLTWKEVNPEYSLKGFMLKLKLQYFGHLMRKADSLEKKLMLGKTGQKEKGMTEDEMVWLHHQFNGHEFEQTLKDSEKKPGVLQTTGLKDLDTTAWLNNFYRRETIQQSLYNKIQVFDVWYLLWIPRLAFWYQETILSLILAQVHTHLPKNG